MMLLAHRQRLSLDDALARYVPELAGYRGITIRHLLHHTSGLPDYMTLAEAHRDGRTPVTAQDVVQLLQHFGPPVAFRPGDEFEYSNTGYALLEAVLTRVTGQSYPNFMKVEIFDRLGMAEISKRMQKLGLPGTQLRRPMMDVPGGRMIYSTGSSHVLGAIIATATGKSLLTLARERLGAPLGIEIPAWRRDPQGFYFGGNEMSLTPRAMLRLAVMLRDKGRFGGAQVIAPGWVEASLTRRTVSPFSGLGYGYGWFLSDSGFCLARGYGGQIIAAHPGKRLAVAITSDPGQPARSEGYFGELMALLEGPVLALA